MSKRLPPQPGEWIDRNAPVSFRFEGQAFEGFRGDVLTSALWASGVRLMGRSFKYHRPRSVYSLSGYDANVLVETAAKTNLRGDLLPIEAGLDVRAVNTSGGLAKDRYAWTEKFGRFMPVGFYYKAFHTPRRLFSFYENKMRQIAGLGRINVDARTPPSPKDYDFCELLVVGAGPSGLSAAIAAAEQRVDVLVVDEQRHPGGSLCWQQSEHRSQLAELLDRARSFSNLRIRTATQAAGWYADQWVALVDKTHVTKLRTKATIVASGAIEQPAVFCNNDVPGVTLGSAAQRLIKLYAVKPFEQATVLAANEDGYRVALDLHAAGVKVAAIVDLRAAGEPTAIGAQAAAFGIEILMAHAVYEARPRANGAGLESVMVCPLDSQGMPIEASRRQIACDGLAVSVGWAPNSNLLAQSGAKFTFNAEVGQLVTRHLPDNVFVAGRANGIFPVDERLADGRRAGLMAAASLGRSVALTEEGPRPVRLMSHPYPIFPHPKKKNFVDLDEDLHLVDFVNAHQEGYDNIELLKRYSTVGMGPSQGKLSNMNAVRILARLNDQTIDKTGTTTGRPFHQPVSIGLLAGRRFHPHRHTPLDAWHRERGAVMIHVGAWFRPEYYPVRGKVRNEAIFDEAVHVRNKVGLIDLSTLTKIHVLGPDAARFLEYVYTGNFQRQKPGTTRYAMACDESGVVLEEGLIARLADDRFYITASTAGGEAFYREMQRWALIAKMQVTLANATGHWGAMNVAGPDARRLIQRFTGVDLTADAFPANGVREGHVAGVDALIMRSGFLGELSYELHLPASGLAQVWLAMLEKSAEFNIRPFGVEAQRLLRLEKGHLITGQDTDALTTPFEAHLDKVVRMEKPFFVGKRSLQVLAKTPLTRKLVGVAFQPGATLLPEECQLIIHQEQIVGRLTSIARQSTVGRPIGLAFVRPDLASAGTPVHFKVAPGRYATAQVVDLPFYDPQGLRQK